MDFRWQLAVGDDTLTDEEIAALAAAKAPLVRLRGQWVAVDSEQLKRGLDFLARERSGQATAAEILRLAASHPDDLDTPLPLSRVTADGWLGELLGGSVAQSLRPVPVPDHFQAALRPTRSGGCRGLPSCPRSGWGPAWPTTWGWARRCSCWPWRRRTAPTTPRPARRCCCADVTGRQLAAGGRPVHAGLRVYAHHGPQRLRGEDFGCQLGESDLVVTTYATATRDIEELAGYEWRRVVLDEAQAIKNSLSQTAKAAKRLRAGHRVALTGTPVENRLAELWSIMDFLNPGMLGSGEQFRARYAIPSSAMGSPSRRSGCAP